MQALNLGRLRPPKAGPSPCSAQHPHNSLAYTTGPSPGTQTGALLLHRLKKIIRKGQEQQFNLIYLKTRLSPPENFLPFSNTVPMSSRTLRYKENYKRFDDLVTAAES